MEDQIGSSPAHRPTYIDKEIKTVTTTVIDKSETAKAQTLEFLMHESEYSAQIDETSMSATEIEKVYLFFT